MSVPDNWNYKLSDVIDEINPSMSPKDLGNCFALAVDEGFDPVYKGDKDHLRNFRNYHHQYTQYLAPTVVNSIYAQAINWAGVRGLSSGNVNAESGYAYCFVENDDDSLYTIHRLFMKFDLSSLQSTWTLTEAYLEWWRYEYYNTQSGVDGYKGVLGTQGDTLEAADYSNFSSTGLFTGTYSTRVGPECSRTIGKLMATSGDLTNLETYLGDDLYVCLRHSYDYSDNEPTTDEKIGMKTWRSGEIIVPPYCFYKIRLKLTYTT